MAAGGGARRSSAAAMRSRRAGSAAVVPAMSPPVLLSRTCADVGGGPAGAQANCGASAQVRKGAAAVAIFRAANVDAPHARGQHADLHRLRPGGRRRAGVNDIIVSLMPLVLIFVVFYFLLIRPQQQKVKQHRDMVENLKRGDQVVTGGGILGKVAKVEAEDQTVIGGDRPQRAGPGVARHHHRGDGQAGDQRQPRRRRRDRRGSARRAGRQHRARLQRFFKR